MLIQNVKTEGLTFGSK